MIRIILSLRGRAVHALIPLRGDDNEQSSAEGFFEVGEAKALSEVGNGGREGGREEDR